MLKRLRFFCVFTQQAINSRHSKKHSEKYHLLTTFKGGGGVILLTIFFAPLHFIHV